MYISKRNRTMIRATAVTLLLLFCGIIAVFLMGKSLSVIEKNAFGNDVTAFSIYEKDVLIIFGQKEKFPIISFFENVKHFFLQYSPGIIKLLSFATNGVEELVSDIIYKIVSSLR